VDDFKRISVTDGIDGMNPDDFSVLAKSLPSIATSSAWLLQHPELYYSRLPSFLHGFCYGGLARLFTGDLAQLWEQGYLRDDEVFFFGGTGGFSGSILWGVNAVTGEPWKIRSTFQALWEATQKVWCPEVSLRTVERPGYAGKPADFTSMTESLFLRTGGRCFDSLQPPLPASCRKLAGHRSLFSDLGSFVAVQNGLSESEEFEIMTNAVSSALWEKTTTGQRPDRSSSASTTASVSWHESMMFAGFLSSQDTEYHYRLPTETEWVAAWKLSCTETNTRIGFTDCFEWCSSRFISSDANNRRSGTGFRVLRRAVKPSVSCGHQPWCSSFGENETAFRLVRIRKEKH